MLRKAHTVKRFGQEQEPIVVIDNFCGELDRLIASGRAAIYAPATGYPGVRANADVAYLSPHSDDLADILFDVFGFSVGFQTESCSFSIITTTPHHLSVHQRIPHYDDTGANLLAFLHYTGGSQTGGTAFYQHRRTGFETVTPDREATYRQSLQADDADYGLPPAKYCYAHTERYRLIGEVEARPDRMVIYRGRTLHSGIIPADLPLVADPERGRLTVNTFVTGIS